MLHESERILKQKICIVIFKFGAGIQSCLFKRIYLRLDPSRSIEHSVNLHFKLAAIIFLKFFCSPVLLFELQAQRVSGQLLSHPKDKLALSKKLLLPVLNVAELFCLFVLFFGSLAPVEDKNEKKNAHSHTANDRQTNSNKTKK